MAAFMATQTEHSPNQAHRAPRRHPAQPVTTRAESGGSTPTRGSDLAYGTPGPPQASAGASGEGRGALVPGLCIFHRTLQDRASYARLHHVHGPRFTVYINCRINKRGAKKKYRTRRRKHPPPSQFGENLPTYLQNKASSSQLAIFLATSTEIRPKIDIPKIILN